MELGDGGRLRHRMKEEDVIGMKEESRLEMAESGGGKNRDHRHTRV